MPRSYMEASRLDWTRRDGSEPYDDQIRTGALQRIAAAVEVVSKRYNDLMDETRRERDRRLRAEESLATERRRTAALRGVIKRMKRSR